MKLVHLGAIATSIVLVVGVAMLVPAFTQHQMESREIRVMLSFSVVKADENTTSWCSDLASLLKERGIKATVFVTGQVAETNPGCIRSFSSNVDIGSQSYSYVDLIALGDYSQALEQVEKGKEAVDKTGNLNSLTFRAPHGSTDGNIYSLLSRSGIVADFSYVNQYNKYENDQFVRYDLKSINGDREGLELFSLISDDDNVRSAKVPVAVNFDNTMAIGEIDDSISFIGSYEDVRFVNASDLVGQNLTIRAEWSSS